MKTDIGDIGLKSSDTVATVESPLELLTRISGTRAILPAGPWLPRR
jgi:hypothetical protein